MSKNVEVVDKSYLPEVGTPLINKKCHPFFIALTIIGGVGIIVGSIGLAAYGGSEKWWNAGDLTQLGQNDATIMMATGLSGGTILLAIGVIGMYKTYNSTLLTSLVSLAATFAQQGVSYNNPEENGNADLVIASDTFAYACVVDGTGHNDPVMRASLAKHFGIINQYETWDTKKTTTELVAHFCTQMSNLDELFRNKTGENNTEKVCKKYFNNPQYKDDHDVGTFRDVSYKPAMSFVQLVPTKDSLYLLTAQADDTMVVVEMADGTLRKTQLPKYSKSRGLGYPNHPLSIKAFDITGAKRVIGFSDGIGEFITFAELQKVIHSCKDSSTLFEALQIEVCNSKSKEGREEIAANGTTLKTHNPDNEGHSDDQSLFVLDLRHRAS